MYTDIYVNGETETFYCAAPKCTDNGTRGGFISKEYVKLFENIGTGYVTNPGDNKYNMSYISVHRYPFVSSEKTDRLTPGTNLNLLLRTDAAVGQLVSAGDVHKRTQKFVRFRKQAALYTALY